MAHALIEERVAACVQVAGPITSIYRWDGNVESSSEFRLVIKTTVERESEVYDLIQKLHDYDVPQIVSVPFSGGLDAYLDWISTETA